MTTEVNSGIEADLRRLEREFYQESVSITRVFDPEANGEDFAISPTEMRKLPIADRVVLGLGRAGAEGLTNESLPEALWEKAEIKKAERSKVPEVLRRLIKIGILDRVGEPGKVVSIGLSQPKGVNLAFRILEKAQDKNSATQ